MNEAVKKQSQSPESYRPKKPEIISMTEQLCREKIIETVTIEGVKFTIIDKSRTLYAGVYSVAPDLDSEPDFNGCMTDQEALAIIKDSVTPDRLFVLSIDYTISTRPRAMLRGQETTSYDQPEGIHVIEAEPTILIKLDYSDEAWALTKKLTGEDNPEWHMAPLFGLIKHIFVDSGKYGYALNSGKQNGNEEMECYCFNGDKYVTVPVKKTN